MATVDPRAFDWGSRIMQGMEQGRDRRLQDIALGQQQEDRAREQQERQMRMQNMQATQAQQQSENQYTQHVREAQTLFSASQALKRVPLERRRATLETWAKANPIIGGAIQHIPPETDLSDESLDDFGYGMSAALGGFQQGQAVQSVEMDENGNLFIIDRSGGIKQAINPQTGKPIVGRKPVSQVAGKRIVQGVDGQGNPTYQVVDLAAGEQPTIKPTPDTRATQTTVDERKAAGFYERMVNARENIDKLEGGGYSPGERDLLTAGQGIRNYLATPQGQQYRQAQENWVRANLRKESGAVIGPEEMAREIVNYFKQPGDGPEVIEQKRQNRVILEQNMLREAGRALSEQKQPPAKEQKTGPTVSNW